MKRIFRPLPEGQGCSLGCGRGAIARPQGGRLRGLIRHRGLLRQQGRQQRHRREGNARDLACFRLHSGSGSARARNGKPSTASCACVRPIVNATMASGTARHSFYTAGFISLRPSTSFLAAPPAGPFRGGKRYFGAQNCLFCDSNGAYCPKGNNKPIITISIIAQSFPSVNVRPKSPSKIYSSETGLLPLFHPNKLCAICEVQQKNNPAQYLAQPRPPML